MKIKTLYRLFFAAGMSLVLFRQDQIFAQPANDNCANATTLSVNAACTNGVTNAGTLTINNGTGIDLIINGTFEDNGLNVIGW